MLDIYLLGPVEIQAQTQAPNNLDLSPAMIGVLAYLSCQTAPCLQEHCVELFWPDEAISIARQALINACSALNEQCQAPVIDLGDGCLGLHPDAWVDVWAFESIALSESNRSFDAIVEAQNTIFDIYMGPFMADMQWRSGAKFQAWILQQRQHLDMRYHQTLHQIIQAYQRANNWHQIIAVCHQAIQTK